MSPPIKWGDILFLTMLSVRPSARPSVRSSVCFCMSVCLSVCLYVRLAFVSALYLLNPWWDFQITRYKCQVWWDYLQCVCFNKVGSRSRSYFKVKLCLTVFRVRSISVEPLVGFSITRHKCQVWWDDVQCVCFTKVGSRSRSYLKVKHFMTVFCVRFISF